jgi:hypothetical protein
MFCYSLSIKTNIRNFLLLILLIQFLTKKDIEVEVLATPKEDDKKNTEL